jgi:hypothetical protein
MNFNLKNFYTLLPQHKNEKSISPEFLSWFIGFVEGDGIQKLATFKLHNLLKTSKFYIAVRIQDRKSNTITNIDQECAARLTLLFNGNLITT